MTLTGKIKHYRICQRLLDKVIVGLETKVKPPKKQKTTSKKTNLCDRYYLETLGNPIYLNLITDTYSYEIKDS